MASRLKRAAATLAIAAGITAGAAGTAAAAISYVGGGTWYHGMTGIPGTGTVYSNYFHSTRCHGSTADGIYTIRSAAMLPGYMARADAPRDYISNNTYWRHCG